MSFLDDIVSFGSSLFGGGSGFSGLLGNLAGAALSGYALNQITSSINKENSTQPTAAETTPDYGVRLQVTPDTQHKIPVVYGSAILGGIITDAQLSSDKKVMSYVITLCEQTGTKFSDGLASQISFEDIYWNDQRLVFKSDGITVAESVDRNGSIDRSLKDLVQIFCYSGSSANPVVPENYAASGLQPAWTNMQGWGESHTMNDLVFIVVKVTYNKDKGVVGLGDIKVHLRNTMTMPGDCIYDYMTNTRYGAGIAQEDIYRE